MARVVCLEKLVGLTLKMTLPWVACVPVARRGGAAERELIEDYTASPASQISADSEADRAELSKESPLGPRIGQSFRDVSS